MARFLKSRKESHGKIPGSLIFIGNKKMENSEVQFIVYNKDSFEEKQIDDLNELPETVPNGSIMWLNINGLHNIELISQLGQRFSISQLELEDIVNTDQRPKITEDETNINIFLKVLEFREKTQKIHSDQVSFILGKDLIITFQERRANYFEPVRERIRNNKGRIRQSGPDYLAYTLIDTLVDGYIHNIETLGSSIEALEEEVFKHSQKETIEKIYRLKTNISFIRKTIWPLKEIMIYLNKSESNFIHKKTLSFYKDLQDLTTQALEAVDIYHNMTNDFLNIYHTNLGNRTNDVMKFLTIFASIFIPLTFIAGVYGTNFDNLPELHFKYSYFIMIGIMTIIAAIMLYYFKRKDWL